MPSTPGDWDGVDEVLIDIARDHPTLLMEKLEATGDRVGRERIRLALPPLTRKWEEKGILHKVEKLRAAGWNRWEAGNLSAWSMLGRDPLRGGPKGSTLRAEDSGCRSESRGRTPFGPLTSGDGTIDLATDWSVYVVNRVAAVQLLDMGVTRFALSPEDGLGNLRLAARGVWPPGRAHRSPGYAAVPRRIVCLRQPHRRLPRQGQLQVREHGDDLRADGEKVTALDYHCRTIVLNQGPFCLSPRLNELAAAGARSLRVDFIYRPYAADEARDRWRLVRAGRPVPGGHAANFDRGML